MLALELERFRKLTQIRMDELIHLAAGLIPAVAGPQPHGKVTEIPDARTVRYYVSEGLVDPPSGQSGGSSLFEYRHLLQIVLIKSLQSRHFPIRLIRERISGRETPELERTLTLLLQGGLDPFETRMEEPLETYASRKRSDPRELFRDAKPLHVDVRRAGLSSAYEYLESLAGESSHQPRSKAAGQDPGWQRHELYPGVELHIRSGASLPSSSSFPSMLASRLRAILDSFRRRVP